MKDEHWRLRLCLPGLVAALVVAGLIGGGCGGDDDDDSAAADDDAADDDAGDDDSADDDANDDDTWPPLPDDDSVDDDTDDDAVDPWAGLNPTGDVLAKRFGVSSHLSGGGPSDWRDAELAALADAGIGRIRRDFHWDVIELADNDWHWDYTDTFRDIARDRGFDFDALLAYGVDWAMPGGETSEIDPADYADFAGHVAARYCDDIKRYEIWNEENLSGRFWIPVEDPDHYGDMLAAAYDAVHAACPDAEVIFGGMAPMDWLTGPYGFFSRVYARHADVCDHFDAMAIHPYTVAQHSAPEVGLMIGEFGYPDIPGHVADIRARMAEAGCAGKPIHFTEFGWPSIFIGDTLQAEYLVRGMLLAAMDGVDGLYWYTFWDGSGTAAPITEDYFGLFSRDNGLPPDEQVPKPSYEAYATLASVLGDTRYAADLAAPLGWPAEVYAAAFVSDSDDRVTAAVWDARRGAPDVERAIPFPPGAIHARVLDLGGAVVVEFDGPEALVTPDRAVTYVEFEIAR